MPKPRVSFVVFFSIFLQRKTFFSPDVDASRVRKRTIRSKRTREANGAKRPARPISKCMRTRTRVRACVHFHRARRNCKVAYMQGVKLRRSFDLIDGRGYRDIDSLQILSLPSRWVSSESGCATELLRIRSCLSIDEVWRKSFIATVNLRSSLTSRSNTRKNCVLICDEITVSYEISLVLPRPPRGLYYATFRKAMC